MSFQRRVAMEQGQALTEDDYIIMTVRWNTTTNFFEIYPDDHYMIARNNQDENIRPQNLETRNSFQNLERFKIEGGPKSESMMCPICLGELLVGIEAIRLPIPCSHVYHQECIIQWLNKSNTCPLCRRLV